MVAVIIGKSGAPVQCMCGLRFGPSQISARTDDDDADGGGGNTM